MKPTRELYLRRRPQTGARKCPTGPTTGKDNAVTPDVTIFIHSGYFYSASSSPLLLRGTLDYRSDTVLELACRSTIGNCEWRTCPLSLHGNLDSHLWPIGRKAPHLTLSHHTPH